MGVAVARRAERPSWLNLRTCLGLILFSLAVVTGWHVLSAPAATISVWVAGSAMPEGAKLRPEDLEVAEVDLPPERAGLYLSSSAEIEGHTLLRPVGEGELLAARWVAEAGTSGLRSITLPIAADHAVGGSLAPGDRVDVFATVDADRGRARTTLLVGAAEVEALVTAGTLVEGANALTGITLSVPPEEAAKIAFAIRNADIDIARLEGEASDGVTGVITAEQL